MKQFQGEYLGRLLGGFFKSTGGIVRADGDGFLPDNLPPEWRLSKKARRKHRKAEG